MTETVHLSGSSDRCIVFVHGRSFKPSANEYLDLLVSALCAGVEADSPDAMQLLRETGMYLAYYGDITREFLTANDEVYDEQLDVADLRNALHELKRIDRRKGFGVARYDRLPGKSAYREFAVSMLAPVIAGLGLGKKLITGKKKDIAEYWRLDSELRKAVLDRVRSTIAEALTNYERFVLIAHCTGSIISFDALWQLSNDPDHVDDCKDAKIDVWVTLGSPLGDSMVRHHLLGHDRKGRERFPTNVLAWHNVSAEDDYMSHDNTVADDFRAMLNKRQISSIRDYHVYNMTIRYGRSNPHHVFGYMIHPRVSKIVADWVTKADGRPLPMSIL